MSTDEGPTADATLAAALAGPLPGEDDATLLTLGQLAERSDLPLSLLEAVEREGLLIPRVTAGEHRYTMADAEALRAGLVLVEAGLPLDELFNLARGHASAMREVADDAVDVFIRFIRDPIQSDAGSDSEASERLLTAFREMLPATSMIVAHHFRRLLLNAAQERIERDGDEREVAVLRREQERQLP